MLEDYIEILKPLVIELFQKDTSGHDISHLERTMKTALYLQEKEGGDRIVIGIASYLHDVHRVLCKNNGAYVDPKESLPIIKYILSKLVLTDEQVGEICLCIEFHEHYNWNGYNVDNINALIVQDADNLDAIGAIGIGRTFSYGGTHNIAMYAPDIPLRGTENYSEASADEASTIHHFYHKLFKLGENMNTKTAKELAKRRIAFMRCFVAEFLTEWNAAY